MATAPRGSDWSTKLRVRKASFVNTLTGRSCSLECCDYTQQHREMEESLLPECAQGKEETEPHSKRRKRNSDGSSISKREATEKCRPLSVYQKPRPVVKENFFAPLRAVPMQGAEVCDETTSLDNNL
jgi:hypothetical protein